MSNILNFIKEKSYYLLGATVLLIVVLIIISSCSGSSPNTYESIEKNMTAAAQKYYESRSDLLPKEGSVRVSISTLVDAELMSQPKDPQNTSNSCEGYVEVEKVDDAYVYTPFLTCKGNYESKYLSDIIKSEKIDVLGNGIYIVGNDYVYRGENLNNYVNFNNQLWRIISVNEEGIIKLVLANKTDEMYSWDTQYNTDRNGSYGITSNYLYTDIRETLNNYYENNFTAESKAKMVKQDLCVGSYLLTDEFNKEKECLVKQENEYIGLLNVSDYYLASLDENCKTLDNYSCGNRNYLNDTEISTWSLNTVSETTYKVLYISGKISSSTASNTKRINPVIYLKSKVVASSGEGTLENPYIIK